MISKPGGLLGVNGARFSAEVDAGLFNRAEKELAAFVAAVSTLHGEEQARAAADDWLLELTALAEPCKGASLDFRAVTIGAARRIARRLSTPSPAAIQISFRTNSRQEGTSMEAIGLLVTLEARRGKEADAEAFLKSAQPLALDEKGTLKWYAIKLGPGKFGIFDTFANEGGRNAHLTGEIAKALGARANELLAVPPQIDKVEVLASTPLKG